MYLLKWLVYKYCPYYSIIMYFIYFEKKKNPTKNPVPILGLKFHFIISVRSSQFLLMCAISKSTVLTVGKDCLQWC